MKLKIIVTGAGSGGHITPILAVATELKRLHPTAEISYIGQRGDSLADIPAQHPAIDAVYSVRAGKFRRYHGEGLKQLLDVKTMALNARDAVYVLIGLAQSWRLLRRLQPDVVFIKGGFVGVPVGLASAQLKIPFITHDSDAIPGLANRIIARWATTHAVALPVEVYNYPTDKTITTGIPLQETFVPVTPTIRSRYRAELDVAAKARMLFVIGGGLGSQRVNKAVAQVVPHLLREFPDLIVVHGVGRANEAAMMAYYKDHIPLSDQGRVQAHGYLHDVFRYSGAADVVVTRAGATNLAEFALQGAACIVVPSPFLTGGHQMKNAQYLADNKAAIVLDEASVTEDPNRLAKQVSHLLAKPAERAALGAELATFARPHATHDLAKLILLQAQKTAKANRLGRAERVL